MCGWLSCTPNWGPGLQPRPVPWLGIEPVTLWLTSWHSVTEPQQPGLLFFWGTYVLFSIVTVPVYTPHSHQQYMRGSFFSTSSSVLISCFFIIAILIGVKWYVIVLICISKELILMQVITPLFGSLDFYKLIFLFFISLPKDMFYWFERKEWERKTSISCPSCTPCTHNLGMCSDEGLSLASFGAQDNALINWATWPGLN